MADKKISQLTALTTPANDDLLPIVDDPAGSPITKKITWANIKAAIKSYYDSVTATLTNKTLTSPVINTGLSGTAKATGAEVTTGTEDAKFVTPKAIGDAGVNTRLLSKVVTFDRDMTTASGDVSYTGVGFQPTAVIAFSAISSTYTRSFGIIDSGKSGLVILERTEGSMYISDNRLIQAHTAFGDYQYARVKSYDADGFTLTWTKGGSPTGTLDAGVLCFR